MLKLVVLPAQPLNTGVTVIVPEIGTAPPLTPVKAAMSPVPDAARPMAGLLLVQLNTVLPTAPVKLTTVVLDPLHTVWFPTAATVGVG